MLAASLFFVTVIALAMGAMLEGSLAFARVSARHAAEHYAELGLGNARSALVAGIAAQVAARSADLVPPPPLAPSPACVADAASCPFNSAATFALEGSLGDSLSTNVSATDLQTHPTIAEGRLAATIVETVTSTTGVVLANRTQFVTLRTFSIPPFAAIDGITDAAGARDVPYEGDAGGCDPATPTLCDSDNLSPPASPAPAGSMNANDTRIRALSQCYDGGSGACNGQAYVDADPPNIAAETPWFNGNAQGNGWSR